MKKILLLFSICATSFAQTSVESILKSDFSGRKDLEIPVSENPIQKLPVIILKGKQQGPVMSVVAGVHGYEYPPIVAVQELLQEIDPEKITGTLINCQYSLIFRANAFCEPD